MASPQYKHDTIIILLLLSTMVLSFTSDNSDEISSSPEMTPPTHRQDHPSPSTRTTHPSSSSHPPLPGTPPSSTDMAPPPSLTTQGQDHPSPSSTTNQPSFSSHLQVLDNPPSSTENYHPGQTSGHTNFHIIENYFDIQDEENRGQDPSPISHFTVSSHTVPLIENYATTHSFSVHDSSQDLLSTVQDDNVPTVIEEETDDENLEGYVNVSEGGESFQNGVSRLNALINFLTTTVMEHFPAYARGEESSIKLYDNQINSMLGVTVISHFWCPFTRCLKEVMAPDPSAEGVSPNQAPQVPAMARLPPL